MVQGGPVSRLFCCAYTNTVEHCLRAHCRRRRRVQRRARARDHLSRLLGRGPLVFPFRLVAACVVSVRNFYFFPSLRFTLV